MLAPKIQNKWIILIICLFLLLNNKFFKLFIIQQGYNMDFFVTGSYKKSIQLKYKLVTQVLQNY